jgi:site-specific DNA recombinase
MVRGTPDEQLIGALYSRISTSRQKDGISLEQQDRRMSSYTEANNILVPEEYHFKEQESGYKSNRSDYDQIRELVREHRIQVLVVYGSDRHTRDPIHGEIFRSELRRNNVALHIVTEGGEVDIITPTGQFMRRQMDNFNWYWGKMIQQTTMDKKREYAEIGVPLQQGQAPFGYKRVGKQRDAKLEQVPEEIAIAKRVLDLLEQGYSCSIVAEMMKGLPTPGDFRGRIRKRERGEWTKGAVWQIGRDEIYAGVYYGNRLHYVEGEDGKKRNRPKPKSEWIPCSVPPVITREQWDRIQQNMSSGLNRSPLTTKPKYNYLLSRIVKCKHCGLRMSGHTVRPYNNAYYRCNSTSRETVVSPCGIGERRVDEVDETVWEFTKLLLKDPDAMLAAMQEARRVQSEDNANLTRRIEDLDQLIAEKRSEMDQLVAAFRVAKGKLLLETLQRDADSIAEVVAGLEQERARLMKSVGEYIVSDEDIASLKDLAAEVLPLIDTAEFSLRRKLIELLGFTFHLENDNQVTAVYVKWHIHYFRCKVGEDPSPWKTMMSQDDVSRVFTSSRV